jgi:hypothetical protein
MTVEYARPPLGVELDDASVRVESGDINVATVSDRLFSPRRETI